MGSNAEPPVSKGGPRVVGAGVKKRRVSSTKIKSMWRVFEQQVHLNTSPWETEVVRIEGAPPKVYCNVYCPFGMDCGRKPGPQCFANVCLHQPERNECRRLLKHLRNKHPDIAAQYGINVIKEEVTKDEHEKMTFAEQPTSEELNNGEKVPITNIDGEKGKISDTETDDVSIMIGSGAEENTPSDVTVPESMEEYSVCTLDLIDSDDEILVSDGVSHEEVLGVVKEIKSGASSKSRKRLSKLEVTSGLLEIELEHNIPKAAMEKVVSLMRRSSGNLDHVPPSLAHVRETLRVPELQDVEYHQCPCGYIYPDTVPLEKRDEKAVCGLECGRDRFEKSISTGTLRPWRNFYYFDLEDQIKDLMKSQDFKDSRGKAAKLRREGNAVYESKWFKWLLEEEETAGDEDTSIWSIEIVHMYGKKPYFLIVLHCEDVEQGMRPDSRLLAILPGPKLPHDFNAYLVFIGEEFERLRSHPIILGSKKIRGDHGRMVNEVVEHRPVLGFIHTANEVRDAILQQGQGNCTTVLDIVPTLHGEHGIVSLSENLCTLLKIFIKQVWDGEHMRCVDQDVIRCLEKGVLVPDHSIKRIEQCDEWTWSDVRLFFSLVYHGIFNVKLTGIHVLAPRPQYAFEHLRLFAMHHLGNPCYSPQIHLHQFEELILEDIPAGHLRAEVRRAKTLLQAQEEFLGPLQMHSHKWTEKASRIIGSSDSNKASEIILAKKYLLKRCLGESRSKLGLDGQNICQSLISNHGQSQQKCYLEGKGVKCTMSTCLMVKGGSNDEVRNGVEEAKIGLIRNIHENNGGLDNVSLSMYPRCRITSRSGENSLIQSLYGVERLKERSCCNYVLTKNNDHAQYSVALVYEFVQVCICPAQRELRSERWAICSTYKNQVGLDQDKGCPILIVDEIEGKNPLTDNFICVPLEDIVCQLACIKINERSFLDILPCNSSNFNQVHNDMNTRRAFFLLDW